MKTKSQSFVRGFLSLAAAGMISKILGLLYVVPLQNMIGDTGMGLYTIAYPLYVMMLQIAIAGFPLAMSKSIAERVAVDDYEGTEHIYKVSTRLLVATGFVFFLLTFFGAPYYARLAGNEQATWAIRAIAPALLIVPLLSSMRGFLQGHQQMRPSGTSQVIEQFVRVGTIVFGTYWVLHLGFDYSIGAAAATFGGVLGALVGAMYLAVYVFRMRRTLAEKRTYRPVGPAWPIIRELAKYALPISLAALVLPIAQQVDSLTIINLLKGVGYDQEHATGLLGILTNRGFRLIQMPISFATAMGISLMPAIAEAMALRNEGLMRERIQTSFRLIALITFPATVGLMMIAKPIDIMLFTNAEGSTVIAIVSLLSILMSFELVTTYILQGIGHFYRPIINMMIGTAIKLLLNILLVPFFGIEGAAWSSVIAYSVSAFLNVQSVIRYTHVQVKWKEIVSLPLLAGAVMAGATWLTIKGAYLTMSAWLLSDRMLALIVFLSAGVVGAIVYGAVLLASGGIRQEEWRYIPFGRKLAAVLRVPSGK